MPFANEETTAEVALLDTIATAEADVAEQIRLLTLRKDELQVELGGVRESLEALYESKSTLAGLRTEAEADAVEAEAEAAEVEAEAAEAGQEQDWPEPSGGDGVPLAADAAAPAATEQPDIVLRCQVFIKGLPVGAVDEPMVVSAVEAAFRAVPAYDAASGPACSRVQLYAGGSYAFLTLREPSLAATATLLPALPLAGCRIPMRRPHGCAHLGSAGAMEVPPADASTLVADADADADAPPATPPTPLATPAPSGCVECEPAERAAPPPPRASLETKLYWALRQARGPKPNNKEVQESLAFFKQAQKLLRRRRVVIDVCGGHGLVGALFVAFGHADEAVVLDKFEPASHRRLCDILAPFWAQRGRTAAGGERAAGADADADAGGDAGGERIRYVLGDFRDTLPGLLAGLRAPEEAMVVACHACSHLSDSAIDACIEARCDFAVMACCHKDHLTANQMALVAKTLKINVHEAVDVARLGGIVARGFDCRWRTIDAAITPENRILIGLARGGASRTGVLGGGLAVRAARAKRADGNLSQNYAKIHGCKKDPYAYAAPPADGGGGGGGGGATGAQEPV